MKPINHFTVRTEHILTKETGRTDQSAPRNQSITERHSTAPDPLKGWFDLAKPSRSRQQKRSWKRCNQRGCIDASLLAQLAPLAAITVLIVGGLAYA